jgi:hypothetical protein
VIKNEKNVRAIRRIDGTVADSMRRNGPSSHSNGHGNRRTYHLSSSYFTSGRIHGTNRLSHHKANRSANHKAYTEANCCTYRQAYCQANGNSHNSGYNNFRYKEG